MLLKRLVEDLKRQHWASVGIELVIVVLGVFIGLKANDWSEGHHQRQEAHRYVVRLLADNATNRAVLVERIEGNRSMAAGIAAIDAALADPQGSPEPDALQQYLCRWFVQPDLHLQRATYQELVSTGNLLLLDEQSLRTQLAAEDAAHEESRRLDILQPTISRAAEPLEAYRDWGIDTTRQRAECRFDIEGMRADPRIRALLAQLYRKATTYADFRQRELDAVIATRTQLEADRRGRSE